ncbi:hypothetical protein ATN84_24440 [Paramesorhizobium deserti]|uniref:Uncharacterized protein n=2 Tax=Paramesorhizobium deserti TaxID=1494590 RepID=A0A135HXN1_9HYPH|nr:hypothetical protein ATN84_24440 [Paramesorhizobium deserti]
MRHMGFWFADSRRNCQLPVPDTIPIWAQSKSIDVVVWTGLPTKFKNETGEDFSVDSAIRHLQTLTPEGKAMAAEYVWRAPDLVQTPLRAALQSAPWFPPPADNTLPVRSLLRWWAPEPP